MTKPKHRPTQRVRQPARGREEQLRQTLLDVILAWADSRCDPQHDLAAETEQAIEECLFRGFDDVLDAALVHYDSRGKELGDRLSDLIADCVVTWPGEDAATPWTRVFLLPIGFVWERGESLPELIDPLAALAELPHRSGLILDRGRVVLQPRLYGMQSFVEADQWTRMYRLVRQGIHGAAPIHPLTIDDGIVTGFLFGAISSPELAPLWLEDAAADAAVSAAWHTIVEEDIRPLLEEAGLHMAEVGRPIDPFDAVREGDLLYYTISFRLSLDDALEQVGEDPHNLRFVASVHDLEEGMRELHITLLDRRPNGARVAVAIWPLMDERSFDQLAALMDSCGIGYVAGDFVEGVFPARDAQGELMFFDATGRHSEHIH